MRAEPETAPAVQAPPIAVEPSAPESIPASQTAAARPEPPATPQLFPEPEAAPVPMPMPMPMPMPAPQPARASPGSIFRRMTGLVGGRATEAAPAPPAPAQVRTEPTLVEPVHAPQPRARVGQPEETGLDIPAFLRRQAN
jgi:hypothetical protein